MYSGTGPRRRHGAGLKAAVLAACSEPGASVAAIAQAHGLNANLVHKWRPGRGAEMATRAPTVVAPSAVIAATASCCTTPAFIPVELPPVPALAPTAAPAAPAPMCDAAQEIHIELRRGAVTGERALAHAGCSPVRGVAAGDPAVIRIDSLWLCPQSVDMRVGAERLMAYVVKVHGEACAHHGYLFANARCSRIKLLVHDGFGVWCAARRLNSGRFDWPRAVDASQRLALTQAQFDALVPGLPWQRLPEMSVITCV